MWLFNLLPPSGSCGKKNKHFYVPQLPCIAAAEESCSRQAEVDVMRGDRTAVLSTVMEPPQVGPDELQADLVLVDQYRNELSQAVLQCLHVSPNAVIVHLYDLNEEFVKPNAVIAMQAGAGGAFHCGVEVYGGEWSFGVCGVRCSAPRLQTWHVYKCSIMLGSVDMGPEQVAEVLQPLVDTWSGGDYEVLSCNCCAFAHELCDRLGVGPIPPWVDRFARIGKRAVTLGGWMFPSWMTSQDAQSEGSSFHSRRVDSTLHSRRVEESADTSMDESSLPFRILETMDVPRLQSNQRRNTWQSYQRSCTPPARLEMRHPTPTPRGGSLRLASSTRPPPLPGRVGGSVASVASKTSNRSDCASFTQNCHGTAPVVAPVAAPTMVGSHVLRMESVTSTTKSVGGSVASVGSAASNDTNFIRSSSNQLHLPVHCNSFPLIRGSKIVPTPARKLNLSTGRDLCAPRTTSQG